MTNDQLLRLECAKIAGNEPGARTIYGFITEKTFVFKSKKNKKRSNKVRRAA